MKLRRVEAVIYVPDDATDEQDAIRQAGYALYNYDPRMNDSRCFVSVERPRERREAQ